MKEILLSAFFAALLLAGCPIPVDAGVLPADTVWQGEVVVGEDLLVPAGTTLTIRPGTVVKVRAAESTKTDPEFLSPLTEITVRGRLRVEGTEQAPVRFLLEGATAGGDWAGLLLDGGEASLRHCLISGADSALYLLNGKAGLDHAAVSGNRYGVTVVGRGSLLTLENSRLTANDYGLTVVEGAHVGRSNTCITGNRKLDERRLDLREVPMPARLEEGPAVPLSRIYGDEVLLGDTLWSGRIRVQGVIRVPQGSRLIIVPGTVIEFSRRDTNADTLGENGLQVQGVLIAKGTPQAPIVFRSAEESRRMGDWDAINIMNSAAAQNLVEYCLIEDAYRGLHFHFSRVLVNGAVFRNNYRGIQFQEATVEIRGSDLLNNRSGVQGRDSVVLFADNRLLGNHQGINFLRCRVTASGNLVVASQREGARIREGALTMEKNQLVGNRFGLLIADLFYGSVQRNILAGNGEVGLAMRNVDNLEVSGNYLGRNGGNGLNLQEARATVRNNLIVANGERGIGIVSFSGLITGNSLAANGLFALDLEGTGEVEAPGNWWGGDSPEKVVMDKRSDPRRGEVRFAPALEAPLPVVWPVGEMMADTVWAGSVVAEGRVSVHPGVTLTILPASRVSFAAGAGLAVNGRLAANGRPQRPIVFTALSGHTAPGAWDELLLEHATNSEISHAVIEYATWGVHSHFTNLRLDHVLLRRNQGGIRFRSGPVEVRRSVFTENTIGIRDYRGTALFEENLITGNETGVFVREQGSGITIRQNNIFANSSYNIRVGDFNDEDVHAEDNWWGEGEPESTIYDGRLEKGIGRVLLTPFLHAPLPLEGVGVQ